MQIPVPLSIKFKEISPILRREIDFTLEPTTKISILEEDYFYADIKEKTFTEIGIQENIKIFIKKSHEAQEIGFLEEEARNFNPLLNNPAGEVAGNLHLETDASTGNADLMQESSKTHTMSTSIKCFYIS